MEFRVNAALLVILAVVWAHLTAAEPVAAFQNENPGTAELARMEDDLALNPTDHRLARRLSEAYLDLQRPGLVIATLRAADPAILEHPVVAHRLAQAYEASGRVLDALATSELALARCSRSLGTADSPSGTDLPRFGCNTHQHAVLTMHRSALRHMATWGVASPGNDPRTQVAYEMAARRARIALAD